MRKFILTESEKNEIKSLYRKKGLVLLEQEGEYHPDAPNWDRAKEWAMSKPGAEEFQHDGGISASTGEPVKGYSGAKWLEGDSSFTIFNYGVAREFNEKNGKIVNPLPDNSVLSGDWEWNGNEVIFSWRTNDDSDSSSSTTTDTSNCESLFAEAEKEKTYNPANLKAGKVVIGKGNQGALVKAMQCYLNQKNEELSLGLTPLKVDSIFGNKTKEMTIKFQEQFPNELKADGIIGKNTYAKFGIAE